MSDVPLTVFWNHSVVHPADGTDEATLVLCKSEDDVPLTLRLSNGERRALVMQLADPHGACGHVARLAFLRDQIPKLPADKRVTAKVAARLCMQRGYPAINVESACRRDLEALHREGLLEQHVHDGVRWYTAVAHTPRSKRPRNPCATLAQPDATARDTSPATDTEGPSQ